MAGMELKGVDASIASLAGPFRNIMSFFTYIQSASSCAYELEDCMLSIGILHLRFSRWGAAIKLSSEVTNIKDLHAAVRKRKDVSTAREKLAEMASEFESIARITKDQETEEDDTSATDNQPMTSGGLIQQMRQLTDARRCKAETLHKVRWYTVLEKICHRSFRRQCRLSAANVAWFFCKEDKLELTKRTNELAKLIGQLEKLIPGESGITTSCCNEEVALLVREAPSDSQQRSQLKRAMAGLDPILERAMARSEDGTSPSVLPVNQNGFF